jgi:hypothetical protein
MAPKITVLRGSMLSTHLVEKVVVGWSWTPGRASVACEREEPWRELDRKLRSIAKRRAALDGEELALIRQAIAVQLWRPLGMISMREYLEHVMGYGPHVANERLRVADALEELPAIEAALTTGALSYSAVRELTRIATRKTDEAWVAAAGGKNLRQVEELVAEREPGDAPTDAPKPDLRTKPVTFDLQPAELALMRQARLMIEAERGERLDNRELLRELCARTLAGGASDDGKVPRPRHQVAVTICDWCKQGWQIGAGLKVALRPEETSMAMCDAHDIGSLDAPPGRLTSNIPAATRRLVFQRDGHRCTVPGCRSAQNLDAHHIEFREHGGGDEPENLTLLCDGHHAALHRGAIRITGRAPNIAVARSWDVPAPDGDALAVGFEASAVEPSHVGRSAVDANVLLALTTLGFTRREAESALTLARETLADEADLETAVRAALRHCPQAR